MNLFTFTTNENRVSNLRKLVDRLNKKAAKYRIGGFDLLISDPRIVEIGIGNGKTKQRFSVVDCMLSGEPPIISDWILVGHINHNENISNAITNDANLSVRLAEFANDSFCHHCQTNRLRHDSYVVHNPNTNQTLRVGSTCLKDFMGHPNALQIAGMYEGIRDVINDFGGDYGKEIESWDLDLILTVAIRSVNECGYRSKTKAYEEGETSTYSDVLFRLRANENYEHVPHTINPLVNEITDLVENFEIDPNDKFADYLCNLKQIAENGFVTGRTLGYAVSMVPFFNRNRPREQKPEKVIRSNEFIAKQKDRIDLIATAIAVRRFESSYTGEIGYMVELETIDGDCVMVYAKSETEYTIGSKYEIRGTVTKHTTFRDRNQTWLNRVVSQEIIELQGVN